MKNIVSFSGGRSSALLVYLMKKQHPDTDFVFMDTGAEHPKTYEFVKNVVKHFDINLTCLRVVVNPELGQENSYREITLDELTQDLQPFRDVCYKYGLPYLGGAFCTRSMKLEPFTRYCNNKYGKNNYQTWLGIRADDPNIRVVERRQQENKIMYRGNHSLVSIIAMYQNYSREEIFNTIRGNRGFDSGSCSESCEIFSCQLGFDLNH